MLRKMKSPRWRGRHRQHAPRVASQDEETTRHSRDELYWKTDFSIVIARSASGG